MCGRSSLSLSLSLAPSRFILYFVCHIFFSLAQLLSQVYLREGGKFTRLNSSSRLLEVFLVDFAALVSQSLTQSLILSRSSTPPLLQVHFLSHEKT